MAAPVHRYAEGMLTGTIRSTETREVEVEVSADSMSEARAAVEAQLPAGWVITDAPAVKKAGVEGVVMKAKMANWSDVRDIEADDMMALRAAVPEGYQLLTVLRS